MRGGPAKRLTVTAPPAPPTVGGKAWHRLVLEDLGRYRPTPAPELRVDAGRATTMRGLHARGVKLNEADTAAARSHAAWEEKRHEHRIRMQASVSTLLGAMRGYDAETGPEARECVELIRSFILATWGTAVAGVPSATETRELTARIVARKYA